MHVSRFSCPHCATRLRIRDRMYVGKVVACPDCSRQFEIVSDGPKKLGARKFGTEHRHGKKDFESPSAEQKSTPRRSKRAGKKSSGSSGDAKTPEQTAPSSARRRTKSSDSAADGDSRNSFRKRFFALLQAFRNPVTVCWVTAVIAGGTIVGLAMSRRNAPETELTSDSSEENPTQIDAQDETAKNHKRTPTPWRAEGRLPEARMKQLGKLLAAFRSRHGRFPSGTKTAENLKPQSRLSWLAVLAAESKQYGKRKPQWRRSWRDPANEPFARQRIKLFRNPLFTPTPGRDGMPVTHFVGVAGVGKDGPLLPADHPRAGIFAYHRATRREEIRDGLANTMMVAGVQDRLGGWAVGGPATIRPFTKAPYVNGVDGFGTGGGDRMSVLMADGSVREISKTTSPVIVRRMAAMADGYPLDPLIAGDPLDVPSPKKPAKRIAKKKKKSAVAGKRSPVAAMKPLHVREGKEVVDVAAALSQRILRFEYPRAVSVKTLLGEIEEMAGVPIRIAPAVLHKEASALDHPLTVKLEDVPLNEILKHVLRQAGLRYVAEIDGIRILAAKPSPASE